MILALQTDGPTTKLWFFDPGQTPAGPDVTWDSGRSLADELPGRLISELHHRHAQLSDLTGIIIFSGPGSFTSLRIGHTVANTLADGLNIPIIGTRGENWLKIGIKALPSTKPAIPALPFYGAEANITRPKR